MSLVQQVMPQVQSLPVWLEYVKALGTPIAAIFGACIGGVIAYHQMRTARNKLKLDLFDKRVVVYTAALDLVSTIGGYDHITEQHYDEMLAALNGALWLLDRDAEQYLQALRLEIREHNTNNRKAITAEEKANVVRSNRDLRAYHTQKLKEIFEPFLKLEH